MTRLTLIEAPSSAGAYSPGQERAPAALIDAGLADALARRGWRVERKSDIAEFRWRPDPLHPRAMNFEAVLDTATQVATRAGEAMRRGDFILVLGGDCTVSLGTVAGMRDLASSLGVVYADYDCDLQTPETTSDGALDWMGVAHMLNVPGCLPTLSGIAGATPLVPSQSVLLFGAGNISKAERRLIERRAIPLIHADAVKTDAAAAGAEACHWMQKFETVAVHLDVDLIDFEDLPLAENTRRKVALPFGVARRALKKILASPRVAALTLTEINPDHDSGGALARFVGFLVDALEDRRQLG